MEQRFNILAEESFGRLSEICHRMNSPLFDDLIFRLKKTGSFFAYDSDDKKIKIISKNGDSVELNETLTRRLDDRFNLTPFTPTIMDNSPTLKKSLKTIPTSTKNTRKPNPAITDQKIPPEIVEDLSSKSVENILNKKVSSEGIKYDVDKLRWDLLPWQQLEEVVKVYTEGAKKYGDLNWQALSNPKERWFSAAMRHLVAWKNGETLNADDFDLPHLAHVVFCILALMWDDNKQQADCRKT